MSDLHVSIPGMTVDAAANFVTFRVLVRKGEDVSWQCQRRYQDFARLHAALRAAEGGGAAAAALPELPPKSGLLRLGQARFEPAFLEERRAGLEAYLQRLLRVVSPEASEALDDFLTYAQHWLREALERLEDLPAMAAVGRQLREALELVARGGGGGGARKGSDAEGDDEGGGGGASSSSSASSAFSPGGGSGAGASAAAAEAERRLVALLQGAWRALAEHAAELDSRKEDCELKAQSLQSSLPVLEDSARALAGEVQQARDATAQLLAARARACERERGQLATAAGKVRTVAAEAARVERESRVLEGLGASSAAATARLRACLGGWEGGGSVGGGGGGGGGGGPGGGAGGEAGASPGAGTPSLLSSPALPPAGGGAPSTAAAAASAAAAAAALARECGAVADPSAHLRACTLAIGDFVGKSAAFVAALAPPAPSPSSLLPPSQPPLVQLGAAPPAALPFSPARTPAEAAAAARAGGSGGKGRPAQQQQLQQPLPPPLTAPLSGPDLQVAAIMHAAALDTAALAALAHRLRRGVLLPCTPWEGGAASSSSSSSSSNSNGSSSADADAGAAEPPAPISLAQGSAGSSAGNPFGGAGGGAPPAGAPPRARPAAGNPFDSGAAPAARAEGGAGAGAKAPGGNPFGAAAAPPPAPRPPAAGNPF